MKRYIHTGGFVTEGGDRFSQVEIAYHTWGKLNSKRNNVIWVCHALTANSNVAEWWPGMVGDGLMLDTKKYFIVCANILGSCYGTTGPLSVNPDTGIPWYNNFPPITTRDIVSVHEILRKHLDISGINTVIGASIGGHQALEYSIMFPEIVDNLVFIASNARQSPWAIAFNESQRLALEADPSFRSGSNGGGELGLKAARSIALLSYRNSDTYNLSQVEVEEDKVGSFRASSYQGYQGEKLVKRFNAWSYYLMTRVSDSHNIGRNRGGVENALRKVQARTLAIGIKSDILFPPGEARRVSNGVNDGKFTEIDSFYGHDGFLIETEKITGIVRNFLSGSTHSIRTVRQSSITRKARLVK
jgi:homoserine O-acetyltransferase